MPCTGLSGHGPTPSLSRAIDAPTGLGQGLPCHAVAGHLTTLTTAGVYEVSIRQVFGLDRIGAHAAEPVNPNRGAIPGGLPAVGA